MRVHTQIRPDLQGNILIWKSGAELTALNLGGFDQRNESVLRLLANTEAAYRLPDFPVLRVWTEDRPTNHGDDSWRVLSFCGRTGHCDVPVPDFLFDGWDSVGLGDYEDAAAAAASAGHQPAQTPCLGWIGNCDTSPSRWKLHELGSEHPELLDIQHIIWVGTEDGTPMGTAQNNHLTLFEQVRRWSYLIDLEGRGWSARLKLLLHSGRPVFIQERPYHEYFFEELVPMEHYIPVSNDLSDLLDRVRWAAANPDHAAAIGRTGQALAQDKLTREEAIHRWAQTLTYFAGQPAESYGPPILRGEVDPLLVAFGAPLPEPALPLIPSVSNRAIGEVAVAMTRRGRTGEPRAHVRTSPTVSALMAAYNYEQFVGRAIESAMEQDYPAELLEVVVIDDGSTDSTGEVVKEMAGRYPGRIRLIQQANAGYVAATNRAIMEAEGELLALLDADDVWLADKTCRQVEMLEARPELGMVFSDMKIIDGEEAVVHDSLAWHLGDLSERMYARVLYENVATQSSIMFRRSLREHIAPIPDGIPYADWWVTLRCAQFSRMDYSREPLALYRVHGANLTGSVSGPAAVRECRKTITFQRWALRNLPLDLLTPDEMVYVWSGAEAQARKLVEAAGSFFVPAAEPAPEDQAQADELLAHADRARAHGDVWTEAADALRALACDPFRVGGSERLMESVSRVNAAESETHPLEGAREFVVIADAEDLLDDDDLLGAYAQALRESDLVSLAIDASRLPLDTAARELETLVTRCGLAERSDIDLLAVVGQRDATQRVRMRRRACGLYRRHDAGDSELRVFTPKSLGELRALGERP